MEKTLLLALLFFVHSAHSQSFQYANQPIPIKLNKDDQFQLIQRDSFTHAWTYNQNTLSLHTYNQDLTHVTTQRLHKKHSISGIPFFHLSFPSYYYVVLPLENRSSIYKVFANGTFELVEGTSSKNSQLKIGRIKYVEQIGEQIFAVEETTAQNGKKLSVLHQFDANFQPVGMKHLLDDQPAGHPAALSFKAIDDSTFVTGKIVTPSRNSSTLTVTKLNIASGEKMVKKFASESAEWRYIRLMADDSKNLYIVNQVSGFPKDSQATLRKETSYITKINSAWEAESSISLEGPIRMDSSRKVSLQNTHSFLAKGLILTVSQWTTGLSFDASGYVENQPNNVNVPQSASVNLSKQMIAAALNSGPRTDRPGANNRFLDINSATIDEYSSVSGGALPTYSYQWPNYWKMPVKEYQNFSVIDIALTQIHPKTIDYPAADAFYLADNKLVGIYKNKNKIGFYELHHSEGAKGLREYELNPAYEYLSWRITQADASTYLMPYVYKNNLYFVKLNLAK